jgi:hypothetical protein
VHIRASCCSIATAGNPQTAGAGLFLASSCCINSLQIRQSLTPSAPTNTQQSNNHYVYIYIYIYMIVVAVVATTRPGAHDGGRFTCACVPPIRR